MPRLNRSTREILDDHRDDANEDADRIVSALDGLAAGSGGFASTVNTSNSPLAGVASFPGAWELNGAESMAVNVLTDAPGTLTVEFGIPDGAGGYTVTATLARPVAAGVPYFRALVKMPGRATRVSYANEATAQTAFALLTSYGQSLLPVSASADSEVLVSTTHGLRDIFVALSRNEISADDYSILVDLDDTVNFPHSRTGRIDITNMYLFVDRPSSAVGQVQVGVITRIDGTDADITYVQGAGFEKGDDPKLIRDRKFSPSQISCGVVNGGLTRAVSNFKELGVTAVNTATVLDSSRGAATVTPGVGDIVVKCSHSAGAAYNAAVSGFYHGEVSP